MFLIKRFYANPSLQGRTYLPSATINSKKNLILMC